MTPQITAGMVAADPVTELQILNDARQIAVFAASQIAGFGPDFQKAAHVLNYIDSRRDPIIAALLAPEAEQAVTA